MARDKGTNKFAGNYEVQMGAALDPRTVVDTKAELINKETWPYNGNDLYIYKGMRVTVTADGSVWELIDKSLYNSYSGWRRIDAQYLNEVGVDKLKLSSAVGASNTPVYFSAEGKPVACTSPLNTSITGNAATANKVKNKLTINNGDGTTTVYDGSAAQTIDITGLQEITYSELVALRNQCKLTPGAKYCITDYETIVKSSTYYSVGSFKNSFNIIVTAISENTLSEDAEASFTPYHLAANPSSLIDINNWRECNPDQGREFPADFPANMGHGYVSNTGLRPGLVLRIKYLGTTSSKTPIKGWGADLTVNSSSTTLVQTFTPTSYETADDGGYFYLKLPKGINPKTSYAVHFFAEYQNNISELNSGECGIEIMVTNPSISSWKLKYCLDNDTNRFEWANKESGKGVIYYMKDEYDNEASYDFKNITFNGLYTFNFEAETDVMYDGSVFNSSECFNNTIKPYYNEVKDGQLTLNDIVFVDANLPCYNNYFEENCRKISLADGCYNNRFISDTFGKNYPTGISNYNFYHRPASKNEFGGITTVTDPYIGSAYIDQGWHAGVESNGVNVSAKNGVLYGIHTDSKYHTAFTYIPHATTDDVGLMQIGSNMLEDDLFLLSDGVLKKGPGFEKLGQSESVISSLIQKITYQELYKLRQHDNLIPGMKYRITDYETTVKDGLTVSDLNNVGGLTSIHVVSNQGQTNKFDIIVEAINSHELSEIAQVCHSHENLNNDKKGSEYTTQGVSLSAFEKAYDETTAIPLELQNKYKNHNILQQKWTRTLETIKWNNWVENGDIRIGIKFEDTEASFDQVLSIVGIDFISAKKNKTTGDIVTKVLAADYEMLTIWAEPSSIVYKYLFNPIEKIEDSDDNHEVTLQMRIFTLENSINMDMVDKSLTLYVEPYTPYFHNCYLNSWEIKYCLDNDANRFNWAKESGKGVIYYMKDNHGNEAPYDFKNILFNDRYTFNYEDVDGNYFDGSVCNSEFRRNIIKPRYANYGKLLLLIGCNFKKPTHDICADNVIDAPLHIYVRGKNNIIGPWETDEPEYIDHPGTFDCDFLNTGRLVELYSGSLFITDSTDSFFKTFLSGNKYVYRIASGQAVKNLPELNILRSEGVAIPGVYDLRSFFAKGYGQNTDKDASIIYDVKESHIDVDLCTMGSDSLFHYGCCKLRRDGQWIFPVIENFNKSGDNNGGGVDVSVSGDNLIFN